MTPTVILNLIVSIVAIAGLITLMRVAHGAADEKLTHSPLAQQYGPADELERAA